MFNNEKSREFFDPSVLNTRIQVVGTGAVGGAVLELLARLGIKDVTIWDMDTVAPHNLGNQVFRQKDVGKNKVDAIADILYDINPEMKIIKNGEITPSSKISGIIFLCIDNIDIRRELCTKWKTNPNVKMVIDGRMGLTTGNVHSAEWSNSLERENLLNSMNFTHEEALANTPVSACGLALSVVITPRIVAGYMVSNMISYLNTKEYYRTIITDGYNIMTEAYKAK